MSDPTDPTPATVKRLYALSGNQCAFPKCLLPLVDQGGKVTGRLCHIEGRKPGAARYNALQSDAERRAFENIVLMCPIHHDVIDDDEISYPVDRLKQIKEEHETKSGRGQEPSDDIANEFIANIEGNIITNGSLIVTHNQMGGQAAHSITNNGPVPRKIDPAVAQTLVQKLQQLPPEMCMVQSVPGDSDSIDLANALANTLTQAGWSCTVGIALISGVLKGVHLLAADVTESKEVLRDWLEQACLDPYAEVNGRFQQFTILVGPKP